MHPHADSLYSTSWLDAETFQELKLARTLPAKGMSSEAAVKETVVEEVFLTKTDRIDGVHFARKMEYFIDGVWAKTVEVDQIRANVGLFDSYFSLNELD